MDFEIREATRDDADVIAGYNAAMARETEGKELDPDVIGPGVFSALYRHVESQAREAMWNTDNQD